MTLFAMGECWLKFFVLSTNLENFLKDLHVWKCYSSLFFKNYSYVHSITQLCFGVRCMICKYFFPRYTRFLCSFLSYFLLCSFFFHICLLVNTSMFYCCFNLPNWNVKMLFVLFNLNTQILKNSCSYESF